MRVAAGGLPAGAVRGDAGVAGDGVAAGRVGEAAVVAVPGAVGVAVTGGVVTAGGPEGWSAPPLSESQAETAPSVARTRTAIPTALGRCMARVLPGPADGLPMGRWRRPSGSEDARRPRRPRVAGGAG
ncbi:hypothetical protein VM95_11640 [Streptomyces rubellomurinus]|uniref:Uncharacterized protein n=1 Tax=Streptomyces rubellomurinus (strain ATCC 31215) TaxID=359131 RepID=A0A0F2TJV2_STRR3|nr:hypothetical protein VM95_11640 [Streptomyces rubellomurinus]